MSAAQPAALPGVPAGSGVPVATGPRVTAGLHRPSLVITAAMLVLTLAFVVAGLFDNRQLLGQPVWNKPMKFSVSIAVYLLTLAWVIRPLTRFRRAAERATTIIGICMLVEILCIAGSAALGSTSHFNVTTPVHALVFALMGVTVTVAWFLTMALGVLHWRNPAADPALRLAVAIGMGVGVVGMGLAFVMTSGPTYAYSAAGAMGAHSVGVVDGGPGLPFLGWSTVGGDLRVPHFIGLHALQALPLSLWLVDGVAARFGRTRVGLVAVTGAWYAGLVAITTWQALTGQSVVHPSGAVLSAGGAMTVIAAVGVGVLVNRGRRTVRPSTDD